jgi:arsenate reductase-like glutaredoxin family protein
MASKRVTISHNPSCGTSRSVLALLRDRGIELEVVEYLKTPPSRDQIRDMVAHSGCRRGISCESANASMKNSIPAIQGAPKTSSSETVLDLLD